jgi:pimeloyl-ACP methyl ester carboxylesterase
MIADPDWKLFLETEAQIHFVTIGEHRLRVIEIGTGEPVLFVHGLGDSAYTWHRNLRPLAAAGFRALAYDHPGCGESALPPGFHFGVDDLTQLAVELLDALGLEWVHLVGSSMGGGIGLHLAVYHPNRLRRVVLVAPACYRAFYRPFVCLSRWRPFCPLVRCLSRPWLARPILLSMYCDPVLLTPQVVAQYQMAARSPEYMQAFTGMMRDFWNQAFTETVRHYQQIRVPLHLVWGERDFCAPTSYAHRLAADTGADLTLIAGTGHIVHQARPVPFNDAVKRFLGGER